MTTSLETDWASCPHTVTSPSSGCGLVVCRRNKMMIIILLFGTQLPHAPRRHTRLSRLVGATTHLVDPSTTACLVECELGSLIVRVLPLDGTILFEKDHNLSPGSRYRTTVDFGHSRNPRVFVPVTRPTSS